MTEQRVDRYKVEIKTANEIGYTVVAKRDAGLIRVYNGKTLVDEAWLVVSKSGCVRLERIR